VFLDFYIAALCNLGLRYVART